MNKEQTYDSFAIGCKRWEKECKDGQHQSLDVKVQVISAIVVGYYNEEYRTVTIVYIGRDWQFAKDLVTERCGLSIFTAWNNNSNSVLEFADHNNLHLH